MLVRPQASVSVVQRMNLRSKASRASTVERISRGSTNHWWVPSARPASFQRDTQRPHRVFHRFYTQSLRSDLLSNGALQNELGRARPSPHLLRHSWFLLFHFDGCTSTGPCPSLLRFQLLSCLLGLFPLLCRLGLS